MSMWGATRILQCIPVMCLHGPHFLVAWNMHISCNLPPATHGISTFGVAVHVTAMQGIRLGKYLTTLYHKNTTNNSSFSLNG